MATELCRIALGNVRPPTSRDDSVDVVGRAIEDAARAGASIICFPECYVPGYRGLGIAPPPPDQAWLEGAWDRIAAKAAQHSLGVVLGTERVVDGKLRATVLVIGPDGTHLGLQDKVQVDPSEDDVYAGGSDRRVFTIGQLTFGVTICHEGWRYPETVRFAALRGARLVFHPHYHPGEPRGHVPATFLDPDNSFQEKAMLCRAAENTVWFASVNYATAGSQTTSAIVRPDGTVLAWQPYGVDGVLVADIDLSLATGLLAKRLHT